MAGGKRKAIKSSIVPKGSPEAPLSFPPAATIRALSIPEILTSVLSLCTKADLRRVALTCRKWSAVALNHLWEELSSIVPLLVLVRPLRLVLDTWKIWAGFFLRYAGFLVSHAYPLQEFEGNVADADWIRFRGYACRVRSLKFDGNETIFEEEDSFIAFSSIQALALVHPFGPSLLPNLRKLSWCCNRNETVLSILPFVSSSLSTLELDIEEFVSEENIQRLLRSLSHRTPNLGYFQLSTPHPVTTINDPLAQWLTSTPSLRNVTLPQFFHTPGILASLGRLQRLEELETDWLYRNTDYIESGTSLLFLNGSYPSLRSLHFHSSIRLATELFGSPGPVSQLKEVCFSTLKCYPLKSIEAFLSALALSCPKLEVLILNVDAVIQDDTPDCPLTFDDIRPCLSLVRLRDLRVASDCPFVLRDADVWEMSRAWKNLRALRLCSDPDTGNALENVGTPITILKTFSVAIPELKYLSLYFHGKEVPQFEPELGLEEGFIRPFELDVGFSVVPGDDERAIGYFLGSLCCRDLTISTTQMNWTKWITFNSPSNKEEEDKKWLHVEDLARMIRQTKRSFNARIQTLLSRLKPLEGSTTPKQAG